jgi:hypothetical protein
MAATHRPTITPIGPNEGPGIRSAAAVDEGRSCPSAATGHNGVMIDDGDPMPPTAVRVECYAGYRGDQEPRRFEASGTTIEVVEIVDRWREPGLRTFRVRGHDGAVYLLRHDEGTDRWETIPTGRRRTDD